MEWINQVLQVKKEFWTALVELSSRIIPSKMRFDFAAGEPSYHQLSLFAAITFKTVIYLKIKVKQTSGTIFFYFIEIY